MVAGEPYLLQLAGEQGVGLQVQRLAVVQMTGVEEGCEKKDSMRVFQARCDVYPT
jgi:hypothetical protein